MTVEELLATHELPEKAIKNIEQSGGKVIRNYTKYAELPPLNQIANLTDVLIHKHRPVLKEAGNA